MFSVLQVAELIILSQVSWAAIIKRDTSEKWFELPLHAPGGYPLGELSVGNPPQKATCLFDTGSPFTWVTDKDVGGVYDYKKSSTSKVVKNQFDVGYGGKDDAHAVSGITVEDNVSLASGFSTSLKIGDVNSSVPFEGLIGVSPSPFDNTSYSLLGELTEEGLINKRAFSFYGQGNKNSFTAVIGGVDHEKYDGELKFLPWNKEREYSLVLTSAEVNGEKVSPNNAVVFDTGTPGVVFDNNAREEIIKVVKGREVIGNILYGDGKPCEELDPITFTFENQASITIRAETISSWNEEWNSCALDISNGDSNLIGLPAMEDLYLAIDNEAKTIAVANSKKSDKKNITPIL